MNKVILMGRTTKDPEVRRSGEDFVVANFSIAVDRRYKSKTEEAGVDFFNCVCFGKSAEFVEKYIPKGTKVVVSGHLQNDSYTNHEGRKITTTKVYVEEVEFAESKKSKAKRDSQTEDAMKQPEAPDDGFMHIPDSVDDSDLPFN